MSSADKPPSFPIPLDFGYDGEVAAGLIQHYTLHAKHYQQTLYPESHASNAAGDSDYLAPTHNYK